MDKLLKIMVFMLFPLFAYSQNGFVFKYSTSADEYPSSIIETNDSGFIVGALIGTYPLSYQALLIRLNKSGDSTRTRVIVNANGNYFLSQLLKLDDGTYLGIGGKLLPSGEEKLWLITFSDSLVILKDTSYSCGLGTIYKLRGMRDHSGQVVIYGTSTVTDSLYDPPHPFIFLVTQQSDSLNFKYFHAGTSQMVFSMLEKSDSTGYYMFLFGHYQTEMQTPSQILTLNYQLQVTSTDSIPEGLLFYLDSKNILNGELLVTGQKTYWGSNPRTDKLGILKLNSSLQLISDYFFGPDDTISWPGYNYNLGINSNNKIFYGGATNQNISTEFSTVPSNIILGCFDTSLNVIWQKYYGGDQYYGVWTVNSTTDGGVIIGTTSFDYQRQNHERDIFIIKIDSNGLITGIPQPPLNNTNKILVYPNPGFDVLYVKTQLENAVFHLYDLMGREVWNKNLIPAQNVLQIQNLNSGIYIYKIVKNSQMIECGKWIKE
jgi:hypothetical protein